MQYITSFDVDELTAENISIFSSEYSASDKAKIAEYMKKFPAKLFTSQPVVDALTGEEVYGADNGYSDGEFTWYEAERYYFEKYNIALREEFVDHVMKAS